MPQLNIDFDVMMGEAPRVTTREARMANTMTQAGYDEQLTHDIAGFYADPFGFVMYVFPWGQKGTDLEDYDGPDTWQREQLMRIGQSIQDDPTGSIQEATASGHGVGKSALTSWIVLWMMSTRPHLAGWVTANTQTQLKGKTWRELSVWHKRALNGHWFEWTATRFYQVDHRETWGLDAIPWTEHNSEAFAGLHGEHVLMIMDEASGVADVIWEVSEGAMTGMRAFWLVYGNPTRNTGRFRECFGKYRHRWTTQQVDSRSCKMTDKKKLEEWRLDHGEDSDFFRVRVRGEFPHRASNQFIASDVVAEARTRQLDVADYIYAALLIGCDVARFGDDETVITVRQGRKIHEQRVFRGLNNMQVGAECAKAYRDFQSMGLTMGPVFVDGVGLGSGVVDYLSSMHYPVIDVNVGSKPDDPHVYFNKRVEIWDKGRQWLEAGADIPNEPELAEQLTNIEYDMVPHKDQIRLEKKADMKERGLSSPDRADSLMLTFAEDFIPLRRNGTRGEQLSFEPEVTL